MKIDQRWMYRHSSWVSDGPRDADTEAHLVLVFGSARALDKVEAMAEIRSCYPNALFAGCSTAGEIRDVCVHDGTLVATALTFDSTQVRGHRVEIDGPGASRGAGLALAEALAGEDLAHVLVLSDGLNVNGSALVDGLVAGLPRDVSVSGGLAGDGDGSGRTVVLLEETVESRAIVALGFYGQGLRVACGSLGGWDPFGPERKITRSEGNVLYELDGRSALELYKRFLGGKAAELPTSGLLFPLSLRSPDRSSSGIVRTILAVDDEAQTMTFAGDLQQGWYAQLMKANFERLIDGAMGAARICAESDSARGASLAFLVSCVGRKLVLKQRIEEEVEGVREVLGGNIVLAGFYSLGEISPFATRGRCALHNQTMTITTFSES